MTKSELSVICDFDCTITTVDTAEYILEHFADGDWRGPDRLLSQGKIGLEECMRRQFAMVHLDQDAILEELEGKIGMREGLIEFLGLCHEAGVEFMIASAGLDFVIHHYLERMAIEDQVSVHAAIASYDDAAIRLRFPALKHTEAHSFKDDLVLSERDRGRRVAYLGDGLSDIDAARIADIRFAVKGRPLLGMLAHEGLKTHAFSDFHEVTKLLIHIL